MQYNESGNKSPKEASQELQKAIDWEKAFEPIQDPRRKQRQQYSIAAILMLVLAALLSNHHSVLAVAEWGAAQSEETKRALGFRKGITPHQTTLHRVLRHLDPKQVEEAFHHVFHLLAETPSQERGSNALAIDGKAQRGRLKFEEEDEYKVHAVSICEHQTGIVLIQGHIAPSSKKEEEKEEETKEKKRKTGKSKERRNERKQRNKQKQKKQQVSWQSPLFYSTLWIGKTRSSQEMRCIVNAPCAASYAKHREITSFSSKGISHFSWKRYASCLPCQKSQNMQVRGYSFYQNNTLLRILLVMGGGRCAPFGSVLS